MRGTILIVERDPALRSALSEVLSLAGFEPLTAVSKDEIDPLLTRHPNPVHYVLLGIHSIQEDNSALLHRLTQIQPGMKVILSSGYTEDIVRATVNAPPNTAVTFLRKPFTSKGLLKHIEELST